MCCRQAQPPHAFLGALHVEHGRQNGEQGVAGMVLEHHPSAHKFCQRPVATDPNRPILSRGTLLYELEEIDSGRG